MNYDSRITFFGFLILGVPVAFSIGLSTICTILYEGLPLAVLFQQMMSGMNMFSFLAIPFFVFSGELMLHGGVADKIVTAGAECDRAVRGGLGMAERRRLHPLRRRLRIGGCRRLGDGRGDDPDDEEERATTPIEECFEINPHVSRHGAFFARTEALC